MSKKNTSTSNESKNIANPQLKNYPIVFLRQDKIIGQAFLSALYKTRHLARLRTIRTKQQATGFPCQKKTSAKVNKGTYD